MDVNPESPWNPRVPVDLSPSDFETLVLDWLRATAVRQQQEIDAKHLGIVRGGGGEYKIDVLVTFSQFDGALFVVLVECKHQSRPVEREEVLVLEAKVRDVNAHKGMLFSTSGFQSGALEFAKAKRIATVTVAEGRWLYETRAAGSPPVAPPPGANIQPYAGIFMTKTLDAGVSSHTLDVTRLDAIEDWLAEFRPSNERS